MKTDTGATPARPNRSSQRFEALTDAERSVIRQGLEKVLDNCRTDAEFAIAEALQAELTGPRGPGCAMSRPLSPNQPTPAVGLALVELQKKLYRAHNLISCARAKLTLDYPEDDTRFSIEHVLDLASEMVYNVAGNTETIAITQAADALESVHHNQTSTPSGGEA